MRAARKNQIDVERDIQQSALGTLLGQNPLDAAKTILRSKNSIEDMQQVVDLVARDPAAKAGWKKAITEALIDEVTTTRKGLSRGEDGQVSRAKLTRALSPERKELLSQVYNEDEMALLNQAERLLEPFDQLARRATVGSPTAEYNELLWNTLEATMKLYYGVLKGGGFLRSAKIAAKTLPDNTENVKRLVERAHFDPELAEYLLRSPLEEVNTPKWNAGLNRLLGYTVVAREISDDDEPLRIEVTPDDKKDPESE